MKKVLCSLLFFLACTNISFAAFANVSLNTNKNQSNGLVGWWTFDGISTNVRDLSGQNNYGLLQPVTATSSFPAPGKIGQAFKFDGSSSEVDVADASNNLAFSNTFFTVSSWVKTTETGIRIIASKDGGANGNGWALTLNNGACSGLTKGTVGIISAVRLSNTLLNDGKWHLCTAVYRTDTSVQANNDVTIYVDGNLDQGLLTNSTTYISPTLPVVIGKRQGATPNYFSGSLDDIRVYNRSLSAEEVMRLYNAGQTTINKSNTNFPNPLRIGLTGWWTMDGPDTNFRVGTEVDKATGDLNSTMYMSGFSTSSAVVPGKIGQAMSFNGAKYLSETNQMASFMSVATGTISAWIFPLRGNFTGCTSANMSAVITDSDGGASGGFAFIGHDGTNVCVGGNDSAVRSLSVAAPINRWYHVVWRHQDNALSMWINGQFAGARSLGTITDLSREVYIGKSFGGRVFNGYIDDVRIYSTSLSTSSILQLYNSVAGAKVNVTVDSGNPNDPLRNGLVGWWTFDGKETNWGTGVVKDRSGTGNDGNIKNMSTTTSTGAGKIGQALNFDGSNDYINTSAVADDIATGNVSVSAWIKLREPYNTGSTGQVIVRLGDNPSTNDINLQFGGNIVFNPGGGKLAYCAWIGVSGLCVASIRSSWPADKWFHVVGTLVNGGAMKLYVDGALDNSSTMAPSSRGGTASLSSYLGAYTNNNSNYYKGLLDDVRIYNRVLTPAEVQMLYLQGR